MTFSWTLLAGLYIFKNFVWPNQLKYEWKELHPHKCMDVNIHIYMYMCIYMYESTDKILVLNMYPPCYTGGDNLEGY